MADGLHLEWAMWRQKKPLEKLREVLDGGSIREQQAYDETVALVKDLEAEVAYIGICSAVVEKGL